MISLQIYEEDLVENFILGSGSGGQKINKTSSCVQLKHIPTGIEIKCQKSRSREANRYFAREELCKRIEFQIEEEKKERQERIEKAKRRNRKPSRAQKARRLQDKRHSSEKKSRRTKPGPHNHD
jgi:protein subunit release factor B